VNSSQCYINALIVHVHRTQMLEFYKIFSIRQVQQKPSWRWLQEIHLAKSYNITISTKRSIS